MKYGVIDVGSNSVRLMISDGKNTLSKELITCRLAEGIDRATAALDADAIERGVTAVSFFYEKAKRLGADKIYAFGTAALRNISNQSDFTDKLKEKVPLYLDIISGKEEAFIGALGAIGKGDGAIIDIGGGSTEVTVKRGDKIIYSDSFPLGAVALRRDFGEDNAAFEAEIDGVINGRDFTENPINGVKVYGIGGTITSVSAVLLGLKEYDKNKVHGSMINISTLGEFYDKLKTMTIEERKTLKPLDDKRGEVLPMGVAILLKVMKKLNLNNQRSPIHKSPFFERMRWKK